MTVEEWIIEIFNTGNYLLIKNESLYIKNKYLYLTNDEYDDEDLEEDEINEDDFTLVMFKDINNPKNKKWYKTKYFGIFETNDCEFEIIDKVYELSGLKRQKQYSLYDYAIDKKCIGCNSIGDCPYDNICNYTEECNHEVNMECYRNYYPDLLED